MQAVHLSGGRVVTYDQLCLCNGATPKVLGVMASAAPRRCPARHLVLVGPVLDRRRNRAGSRFRAIDK